MFWGERISNQGPRSCYAKYIYIYIHIGGEEQNEILTFRICPLTFERSTLISKDGNIISAQGTLCGGIHKGFSKDSCDL
jgi:hypothetical protein